MQDLAVVTRGISKQYRLGTGGARYQRLSEVLSDALLRRSGRRSEQRTLWALKDVSLEVGRGEVLGIIGRNGSGKTTLLKIISRITEPTEGYAEIAGRVGSLLEVGTGFHPELTGRENIFLNGAILGMHRAEVARKFDEIVAFAEVEQFLDTPVKRYSSGMHVRLAFAVAAHLEPDVLLVDEVLAVGDAAFQRKCLGKMDDVATGGRTVLFVSHQMGAVERLCSRVVLLDRGSVRADGPPDEIVGRYLSDAGDVNPVVQIAEETPRYGTGGCRITEVRLRGGEGRDGLPVRTGAPLDVDISFKSIDYRGSLVAGILIRDRYERFLCDLRSAHDATRFDVDAGGAYVAEARIDSLGLYPGEYSLGVWVAKPTTEDLDYVPDACRVVVEDDGSLLKEGRLDPKWGQFYVPSVWKIRRGAATVDNGPAPLD